MSSGVTSPLERVRHDVEDEPDIDPSTARPNAYMLLGTGASRQDAVALTRANIRGGRIAFRRGKTGEAVDLPILSELARELALLPSTQMVLLARNDGVKGYAVESFGILFRRWCNEVGLPGCSAHGLRKAGARRLAEAGATEFEVMSFLGHATAREASRCPTFPSGWTNGGLIP